MAIVLKTALAAICVVVVVAVGYLTLSVAILRPPRVNYPVWFTVASLVLLQSGATVVAFREVAALRAAVRAGGAGLTIMGGWLLQQTLSSQHFEGYQLILGAMFVVQGSLTVLVFSVRHSRA